MREKRSSSGVSGNKTRASHKVVGLHASARGTWIFTIHASRPAESLVTVYNPASTAVAVHVASMGPGGMALQKAILPPRSSTDFAIPQAVHALDGRIRVSAAGPVVAEQLIIGPNGATAGS